MICDAPTHYYFSKRYADLPPNAPFETLSVDYWRCGECGFVASRTHQEMDAGQWEALNGSFHHYIEAGNKIGNQPPYADQALALQMLTRNSVVDLSNALDYAAGYGTLSRFSRKYFGSSIRMFDRYVRDSGPGAEYVAEQDLGRYQLVINSAMFEHVLQRADLDEVNALVADDGCLMMHTVVCERVPADPDWFYIVPVVHTAFHTNRSMSLLMQQWGYAASIYSPQAKSWFLFKRDNPRIKELKRAVERMNAEVQTQYFHYKADFVDYWKGF